MILQAIGSLIRRTARLAVPLALTAAIVAALPAPATAYIERRDCVPTAMEALKTLPVDQSDIRQLFSSDRNEFWFFSNDDDGSEMRLAGYDIWVRFNSCQGALVLKMDLDCDLMEIYSRYHCTFPGIPSYW